MADLVDPKNIPQAQQDELAAYLQEMRNDYNQRHFVRNDTFKAAADKLSGPTRKIFIEFLERSCTAEFSGFLLFKELGRRLKGVNPVVAGEKVPGLNSRAVERTAMACEVHGFDHPGPPKKPWHQQLAETCPTSAPADRPPLVRAPACLPFVCPPAP